MPSTPDNIDNEYAEDLIDLISKAEKTFSDLSSLDEIQKRNEDLDLLISKIDTALIKIDEGTYGYCEETDEPISLDRLEARPIATLSLEAQERHERSERMRRDD